MNTYDCQSLNDKEFEAIAVDLLSVEMGRRFERFKPGKDTGVDGRWFGAAGKETVIQCKHWLGSGYNALVRHLREKELPKIARLQPGRYILVTSLPLSRANKAKVAVALAPFVLSESDLFGREDLNDLLLRHPNVERRHYKLWLSSANVLRTMLNAAIEGRSKSELEPIRDEASIYVLTTDYPKARDHLREHHVIILTGEPGVGKTTLARQLVLQHVAAEYELVVIEESVSEAESAYLDHTKQMFYFDDFLGRTYLEALKPKQDSHIVTFLKRVARDATKRFILTSRTNILNQGMSLTDAFSIGAVERNRYELNVGSLTTMDKAQILYSHMWHSSLAPEFREEIYRGKRYRNVITHPNYNPRLVAFILDSDKVGDTSPSAYWDYIIATLADPKEVWAHFFNNQMDQDGRDIVFLTVLNGGDITESGLRDSFFALHGSSDVNLGLLDHRFRKATQHCAGSILDRTLSDRGRAEYTLFNPSVADFAQARLAGSNLWIYYYSSIRTVAALTALEQIRKEPFFGQQNFRAVVDVLTDKELQFERLDQYALRLARIVSTVPELRGRRRDLVTRWLQQPKSAAVERDPKDYIALFNAARDIVEDPVYRQAARDLAETLADVFMPLDESDLLKAMLVTLHDLGEREVERELRRRIIEEWADRVAETVRADDTISDFYDPEEVEDATDKLEGAINDWLWDSGIDLDRNELERLTDRVDVEEVITRNRERAYHEDDDDSGFRGEGTYGDNEIAAVDDLFDRSGD